MSNYSKKNLSLNTNNEINRLKLSHKRLSNWQCFQKATIPNLKGPREQRNIKAAKIWKTKSVSQKNKYDCLHTNDKKHSHKNISLSLDNDKQIGLKDKLNASIELLLKEIEEAKNYQFEIPDLDYKTTTVNMDMLKSIIFKYNQINNYSGAINLNKYNLLKKQIIEIKDWIDEKESNNQSSYNELLDELKNINQTSNKIEILEQKVINNTSPTLKNSSLIEEAKNNTIILKQIENLLNSTQNFNNLKKKKLSSLIKYCNKLIFKIKDNYGDTLGKTEILLRLESRLEEMIKLELKSSYQSLEDYKLVFSKIKVL